VNWRRRWLAPALGIAAVLAIFFAMRPPRRAADKSSPEILVAQAPKSETAPSTETGAMQQSADFRGTPGKNSNTDMEAAKDRAARITQSRNSPADSLAKKKTDAGGVAREIAPSSSAENGLRDEKKEKSESNTYRSSGAVTGLSAPVPAARAAAAPPATAPAPPVPAPQAQDKVQVTTEAPPIMLAPPSVSQSVQVTEAAPQVQTTNSALSGSLSESNVKDLPLNGRNYTSLLSLKAVGEFPVQMNAPSGKILWRAGKSGIIQRSADAGRTWTPQKSPLQEDWFAGAAVSDTVCWIAGRGGAIARTSDGSHWKKIAPPPMAADSSGKFPDWISITASDAKNVTITASDQRHFSTQNAGKTWTAQ
jgi:hypothetical protein